MSIIAFYLGCCVNNDYFGKIDIQILDNSNQSLGYEIKRGEVCDYVGPVNPPQDFITDSIIEPGKQIISEQENQEQTGTILINDEDFIIVLERLVNISKLRKLDRNNKLYGVQEQESRSYYSQDGEENEYGEEDGHIFSIWKQSLRKDIDFPILESIVIKKNISTQNDDDVEIQQRLKLQTLALGQLLKCKILLLPF